MNNLWGGSMKKTTNKPSVDARIIEGLREFADTLERKEPISKKFTCRTVELHFPSVSYKPETVKATRRLLGTSQAMFARFLGVSVKTVRAWEQGINEPSDMACRFMDEIRSNPEYWIERLRRSLVMKESSVKMGSGAF